MCDLQGSGYTDHRRSSASPCLAASLHSSSHGARALPSRLVTLSRRFRLHYAALWSCLALSCSTIFMIADTALSWVFSSSTLSSSRQPKHEHYGSCDQCQLMPLYSRPSPQSCLLSCSRRRSPALRPARKDMRPRIVLGHGVECSLSG